MVRGTPFYFALVVPVCIVLLGNLIVLMLVFRGIAGGSKITKNSESQTNDKYASARIAFACACLLGVTWLFAILAVGDLRDVFQWLFCIFNSLQGKGFGGEDLSLKKIYCLRIVHCQREIHLVFSIV